MSGHGGRSGAELVRATAPFAVEARGRTWRLLLEVSALWIVAEWGALRAPNLPLRLLAAVVASAAVVRGRPTLRDGARLGSGARAHDHARRSWRICE